MKILCEKQEHSYGFNSPLHKELDRLYDLDVFERPENYTDEEYAELIRKYDVLLTSWGSSHIPNELAKNPGNLKYICNITGELSKWIDLDIVQSNNLLITNWGDAASYSVAEGAFSLLMIMLKNIPSNVYISNNKEIVNPPKAEYVDTLFETPIGIYGMGFIGRKFVEYLRPFNPTLYAFDPYVDNMPEGVKKLNSLDELFSKSKILVVHAGLSEETKGSITKELLAKLPEGALFINTARGAIVDEDALFEAINSGKIRAGIDVLDLERHPESVDTPPFDSQTRHMNNALFTAHTVSLGLWSQNQDKLDIVALNCLDNLSRFEKGEQLRFIIDETKYLRMT